MDKLRPPARRVHDRHVGTDLPEHLQSVERDKRIAVGRHAEDETDGVEKREVPLGALLHDRVEDRRVGRHRAVAQGDQVDAPHEREQEEPERRFSGKQTEQEHGEVELSHAAAHEEPEEERKHRNRDEEQQQRRRERLARAPDRIGAGEEQRAENGHTAHDEGTPPGKLQTNLDSD